MKNDKKNNNNVNKFRCTALSFTWSANNKCRLYIRVCPMIPLNVCEPSVPPSTQNPSVSWYVNDPFGKLQRLSRMNENIWGTIKHAFEKEETKTLRALSTRVALLEIKKS